MSRSNEEDHEQSVVVDWLDAHGVLYCAVPNGGNRSAITGARLKRLGAKRGVPDILIFERVEYSAGVALELKKRGATWSSVTKEQRWWLAELNRCGWICGWAAGADEAIEWLKEIGVGR
jgi:hypothetical protein